MLQRLAHKNIEIIIPLYKEYRVGLVVVDLGWVDFDLGVPLS